MPPGKTFFDDGAFQDSLVSLLVYDAMALRQVGHLLDPDDFKPLPGMAWGRPRWIAAERALEHYRAHHVPIARLIRSDCVDYVDGIGLGDRAKAEVVEYLDRLKKLKVTAPDAITGKVVRFKHEKLKASTLSEMVQLQAGGQLTDEKWREMADRIGRSMNGLDPVDYFAGIEARLERRAKHDSYRCPSFFIDPLDELIRGIGPGHLGVVMAPLGRGKSLFLSWLATAYTLQRLNVLYVLLEDTLADMEDRLDAAISAVPIHKLRERPKTVRRRFARYRRLLRTKLKIIDGTEGGMTMARIEQALMRERDQGFRTDALIVDYDDEIVPATRHKERRMEFADVYRDLRQLAGRHGIIVWTAAQTQRGTEEKKILSERTVAEDISKLRKATLALSLGQGEWGPESIYLYVPKHRLDHKYVGCHIVPDLDRMVIYDREKTKRATLMHRAEEQEAE
jgi:hypothetical protein